MKTRARLRREHLPRHPARGPRARGGAHTARADVDLHVHARDRGPDKEAAQVAQSLRDPYERAYFTGIVYERRAKAHHRSNAPHSGLIAYDWLRRAMVAFEEAERLRPPGDDQAILRWNGCVRLLRAHSDLRPPVKDTGVPPLQGD